jgi:hypothetical protein
MTSLKSIILRNGENIFNGGLIIAFVMALAAYAAGWPVTCSLLMLGLLLSPLLYVMVPDWMKHPGDRHHTPK